MARRRINDTKCPSVLGCQSDQVTNLVCGCLQAYKEFICQHEAGYYLGEVLSELQSVIEDKSQPSVGRLRCSSLQESTRRIRLQ